MYHISLLLGWYIMLGILTKGRTEENVGTFTFKEFQYKDTPKNEMIFREFETACEQSRVCSGLKGLVQTHCVRECVSPSCYREIYQADLILCGISIYGQSLFMAFLQYKNKKYLRNL